MSDRRVLLLGPNGNPIQAKTSDADALVVAGNQILAAGLGHAYNGTTWDRWRGNTDLTLLASAARTATSLAPNQLNYNGRGLYVVLNVTATSGTGGLTLRVWGMDPVTGFVIAMLSATAAVTATGRYIYLVYPGAISPGAGGGSPGVTQLSAIPLPRRWFVEVTHVDGSSYTYSVGASLVM
ncbi:MAG: hypothetical protein HY321_19095 [Armatimonadetes bacterium]|nr:hypothetical protein [Armatimonadota bacterium]